MQRFTILCLTFIAGFVDTATFVSAKGLFAAHVTGNFVVFGAALAKGIHPEDYVKLVAFPVFIAAVIIGALLYSAVKKISFVLWMQALLLLVVGGMAQFAPDVVPLSLLALTLVVAMGLQNSLHRYLPGPMTTVMTGTVMNWSAGVAERLFGIAPSPGKTPTAKPMTGWMMLCFASGCIASGFIAMHVGLAACLLPGLLAVIVGVVENSHHKKVQP